MYRKASAALVAAAMAATLVGCSQGTTGDDGEVNLTVSTWTYTGPPTEWWDTVIKGFEDANPNVKVDLKEIAYADYVSTVTTQATAGQAPAVIHVPTPTTTLPAWADAGFLEDLGDYLKTTDIPEEWPASQSVMEWNGNTYGVLVCAYGYNLFYNQDLLDQAGVGVPTTPDELLAAAKAVQDLPGDNYGFAITDDNTVNFIRDALVFTAGMQATWATPGEWNLTDPQVVKAFDLWRTLGRDYSPVGTDIANKRSAYLNGSAAMMIEGPFYWAQIQANAEPSIKDSLKLAVAPFAVNPGDVSHGLSISAGLDEKTEAAAEAFVSYAVSLDSLSQYSAIATNIMARPGSNDALKEDPATAPIVEAADGAVTIIPSDLQGLRGDYADFAEIAATSLHKLLQTHDDTASVLGELQDALIQAGITP